ncbi:TonB family protein [Sphingomonas sp. Leaf343]|uniref:TonB family protein n=1 Tax=Sphingomonas sp. Leaf343 TaxID=1736345 RepID=UPI0009EAC036|nr:TonB family protein [Sphingomonas sp. Leaf343]
MAQRTPAMPHPLTRTTLFVVIAAAHLCAIILLLLGKSPAVPGSEDRTLFVFDVAPQPPPAPILSTPPKPKTIDLRPAGGSPRPDRVVTPPADARPPTRFDTTLTDDAPPAPIVVAGDLPGTGIDLTPGGGRGDGTRNGSGNGSGVGNGNGEGAGAMWIGADWIYKPVRELPYYWPRAKEARRASAVVALDCVLPKPGKPERCTVVGERPVGLGFGEAALGLSRHFRIRPVTRDGKVVRNVTVRVPVTFKTPYVPVP